MPRSALEKPTWAGLIAAGALSLAVVPPARAALEEIGGGAWVDRGTPRLLLIPQRSVPMFSCTVLVPAGSALETPRTNGAAHYLEHLLFNGTATRSREEIYALTDLLGAYNNASTQRERTVYQLLLPSEKWKEGLELQADMLLHSTLPADMFEKERGIILEELAKDRTDPDYEADLFTTRVLYGDDSRSLPVLGTEESIANMDPEALAAFYRDHYRPDGMTLVVMGDFDLEEAVDEIGRLFGAAAPEAGSRPSLPPRPPFPDGRTVHYREVDGLGSIRVRVLLPMPPVSSPRLAAAELLASVLDSGESSAVSRAVEAACGPTLSCGASIDPGEPWSVLTIAIDLPEGATGGESPGTRAPALGAVLRHLGELAAGDGVSHDLEAARLSRLVEEISLREKMHYYGLMRADVVGWDDPGAAELALRRTSRVTPADVHGVLAHAIREGRVRVAVAGPGVGGGTQDLGPDPFGVGDATLRTGSAPQARAGLPPVETAAERETRRTVLPNGLTLLHQASPDSRTFAAHLLLRGRAALEKARGVPRGTADVVHRLMAMGTRDATEDELRGELARLGAKLKVTDSDWIPYDDYYYTPEFSYVRLETIDSFGLEALRLLGEIVNEPRMTEKSVEKAKAAAAARARKEARHPRTVAQDLFVRALGEGHPQEGGVHGSAEAIESLTREQVELHHAAMVEPSRLILSVSSDLPYERIEVAVRSAFPGESTVRTRETGSWKPAPGGGARVEETTGKDQSWILLGTPLHVPEEDEPALRIAVAVLSDRLADRLREREGLAYSIGASLRLERPGAYVRMQAGTRPENLARMEEGMREVAASLTAHPPTPEEVEGARNRGEGRRRMRRLSRIGQAFALGMAELAGRDPLELDADLPALRSVTPDDVARVAARHLAFESPIVAIAR